MSASAAMMSGCIAGKDTDHWFSPFARGFGSGQALAQHGDLPGVVRFVFAHVKPLAEIVGGPPGPVLVCSHQPRVVFLAKCGQRVFAYLMKDADVVIAVVSLDRLAPLVAEFHGRVPLL